MTPLARILSFFALLGALALAPGCGDDDGAPPDAGADAGDAPDAGEFDAARPDAGGRECVGAATECGTLDVAACGTVMGCHPSRCVGFALACAMRTRAECMMATGTGCSWDGTACIGTAVACTDVSDEAVCRMNTGCSWGAREVCRGTPIACETFARDACTTQPGCMIYEPPHDSGPPMPDAGCGSFDAGTGMVDVDLRVVTGPAPVTPASGAHVRVESACGGFMEMDTAADGTVHFSVPREAGEWDLTAAMTGHAAVSVLDVTNVTLTGDVRLDPVAARPDELPHTVSGTLGGSIGIGNTVQIDAYNFETIMSATATWNSMFYASALSLRQPLAFVALEMDSMGRAVNVATAEVPRTEMDITGVTLALPAPRVAPTTSTFMVTLPASGMITAADAMPVGAFAEQLSTLDEGEYVYSGTGQVVAAAGGLQVTLQHFSGPAATTFAGATADGAAARLNVYTSAPATAGDIVVGPGTMMMTGGALSDLEVALAGASGHDTLVIHIGETGTENPHWRVFAPTLPPVARVPHLPSAVSLTDIGLTVAAPTSVLAMFIKMSSGAAWSTRAANQGVPEYQYTVAGGYQMVSASGR